MKRTLITPVMEDFPEVFQPLLRGCAVYDNSGCSGAKTFFLDRDGGLYLKTAPAGSLRREAEMTRFFHSKGLGPEVAGYESLEEDWLLTVRIPGEDCTHARYLEDPMRLSALLGERLRQLHELDGSGCPGWDKIDLYLDTARKNYEAGNCYLPSFPAAANAEEAWKFVETHAPLLDTTTLIHGDYCLPNIMLEDWQFSGFIDVGFGGLGDRHIDLHWGAWSLGFNLGTDAYRDRFLDAYGRDKINEDIFPIIGAFEVFG